jgi:hypothetical protein
MIFGAIMALLLGQADSAAGRSTGRLVELRPVDRQLLAGHHIIGVLGDVGHVVADALEILGAEQQMRAGRDVARVFHHVGEQFAEDGGVLDVDLLVVGAQLISASASRRRIGVETP